MDIVRDLDRLARSFERHLRAENKAAKTVETYCEGVSQFLAHLAAAGVDAAQAVSRAHIEDFITGLLATRSAATANNRFRALQQFFKWMASEEYIAVDPMAKMKPPHVPEQPVPVLPIPDISALLATCDSKSFEDRRDEAIIRTLADTGVRRNELLGLTVRDVDLDDNVLSVVGKGRRRRDVPFGKRTAKVLDRYERLRSGHNHGDLDAFWLARKGPFGSSGIAIMLKRRAKEAGLDAIHPHQFRHTFAHQWLSSGGQEGDLKRLAGWRSPSMVARYGASAADERARQSHRQFSLGDRI